MSEKNENEYAIPVKAIESDIIILDKRYINKKEEELIKCPHCGKTRWVNKGYVDKLKSTLCNKCVKRYITLFYIDKELDCAYFFVKDKENFIKVLIDYDDADRLFGKSFGISGDEKYIVITNFDNGSNKRMRLTNFILNYDFEEKKFVVDHINHNIYDNRKKNLRIVSQTSNQGNKQNQSNNSSGFRGIHWDSQCMSWAVQVRYNKKFVAKKRFKHFLDAYNYWYKTYHQYYGEFTYNILQDENINLRYAKIEYFDIQNGRGIGCTLFVQGCKNHCKGCFNTTTWDFNGGNKYTQKEFNDMIKYFNNFHQSKRLTLCGGEPLQNLELSNFVAAEYKRLFPNHKLWIYTGLEFENIKNDIRYKALLELCDVLVDGKFIEEQKDLTLAFRGSSNQRVIDVQKSLKENKIVLYE